MRILWTVSFPRLLGLFALAAATWACGPSAPSGPPPLAESELPEVALFQRHYLDPIYREDRPARAELNSVLRVALAPGEYEPLSVGVRSRRALRGLTVRASALAGPGGATLTPDDLEIRITRYIPPLEKWRKLDAHPLQPGYLDRRDSVDLEAGMTQQLWLTVHAPPAAAPGPYRGTLDLSAEGLSTPLQLTLEVNVRRLALDEPRADLFLFGDNWPLDREAFRQSRIHGMNTFCVSGGWVKQVVPVYKDGHFSFPQGFPQVDEVVRTARDAGFALDRPIGVLIYQHFTRTTLVALKQGGVPWPPELDDGFDYRRGYAIFFDKTEPLRGLEHFKGPYFPTPEPFGLPTTAYGRLVFRGWVEAMEALDRLGKERGWPRFWYYLADEPHQTRGSMRLAMTMVRAAHEAAADSFVTCNEPTVSEADDGELWFQAVEGEPSLRLEPYLTTRCYYNKYLGEETLRRTREAGDRYSTYVNIYGNAPASVRYQAGYLAWRLDLDQVMFWARDPASVEFEGGRSFLREWEAVREGVDDLRYITTLQRLVRERKGSPGALASASALLEELRAEIVPNVRAIGYTDGMTGRWVPGDAAWSAAQYDEMRTRIASAIEALVP